MNVLTTPQHVVVWDPEGEYWEGALVDGQRGLRLNERGACTLPCVPDLFRMSSVGGYSKRAWGAGIPLTNLVPAMVAPLTMYCHPEVKGLYWRARLVPDLQPQKSLAAARPRLEGIVRFSADSGQRTPIKGGYQELTEKPIMVRDLKDPDKHGGWTVGGEGVMAFGTEGHYGFALYATAPGLRVAWVAATAAPVRA
jgi:hypothetical protein